MIPPAAWFDRYGITGDSRVPGAYAVNGCTMLEAYTAGLDPTANELFRITDIKILPDDRLQLTLNSVRDDLSSEELTSLFAIVRSTTLGGEETTVPGTAVAGEGCTIWTSTGTVAGDKAFYRVKVAWCRAGSSPSCTVTRPERINRKNEKIANFLLGKMTEKV